MSPNENAQIQALRIEVQTAFHDMQSAITELTAEQRAHLASHEERDRARAQADEMRRETAVTRKWVVGVVISALTVMASIAGVAVVALRLALP